jgi:hypothetical protein
VAVEKSGPKSGRKRPGTFKKGKDPRRGRGPSRGAPNAGRPPDEWKKLCQGLASRPEMLTRAQQVLEDPGHPAWLGAWKFVAEQGYGKPVQPVDATVDGELRVTFE